MSGPWLQLDRQIQLTIRSMPAGVQIRGIDYRSTGIRLQCFSCQGFRRHSSYRNYDTNFPGYGLDAPVWISAAETEHSLNEVRAQVAILIQTDNETVMVHLQKLCISAGRKHFR